MRVSTQKRRNETSTTAVGAKAPKVDAEGPGGRSREQLLVDLQRQVGNRAVAALAGVGAPPPASPVQRMRALAGPPVREVALQRDLISDTRNLLEYSPFDLVVTDADAKAALDKMASVPPLNLKFTLLSVGAHLIERMFDNLASSDKTGAGYARVAAVSAALGLADVDDAWKGIATAGAADQRTILFNNITVDDLGTLVTGATSDNHANALVPFLRTLPRGDALDAPAKVRVRKFFDSARDAQALTLMWCMKARFDLDFGGITAGNTGANEQSTPWEANGMRRMYPVLEALPSAHVARNAMLTYMGRYQNKSNAGAVSDPNLAEGWFTGTEIGVAYDPTNMGASNATQTDAGDPLANVNRFDETVRHEVGHAVDAQLGWSASDEPTKRARGGWTVYAQDHDRCAKALINASDGAIARRISTKKRKDVRNVMVNVMANRTPTTIATDLAALPWWGTLSVALRTALLNDRALVALAGQFSEAGPWWQAGGGIQIGKYVFHESYSSTDWVRYQHAARGWKVSTYQFRAPGEWFAEAYAAYYEPDPRGTGAKLADADPDTKKYFDKKVAPMAASR
jgi:hypothetical protein